MSKEPTAAEILRRPPRVPMESLDSQVSDEHIAELAGKMVRWEVYMPCLFREDSEAVEEEIRHDYKNDYGLQKQKALKKWKGRFGSKATYRWLIVAFCAAKQADLAEKVKQLARQASPDSVVTKYQEHLVSSYTESPHPSSVGWPQAGAATYIDLTLIEAPPQPQLTRQQPEKNQDRPKKVMVGELFENGKSDRARKVVLIEGAAGSGKTTLTWHACREWAAGRLFQQFDLLIHLSLDDPALHSAKTLADLIPHESSDMREAVAKEIAERSGRGVCFLFDAWDEAPPSLQQMKAFIYQLISGNPAKTLPHCSIIVTSRPVAAGSLYSVLTARVVINGFDGTQVEQFADASLDLDARKELDDVLRKNPRLLGLCNLPINAAIVMYLLQLQTPCSKLPSTRTELFYELVINLLLRHMQLRTPHGLVPTEEFDDLPESILKAFKSLCALAFRGVKERKTQFVLKDLKALGVATSDPLDTLGLLQAPRQLTSRGPQQRYSFLHYAVQEFFAAYHISKLSSEEQSEIIRQVLTSSPLSLVMPFYAGLTDLCNTDARDVLLEISHLRLDFNAIVECMRADPYNESSDRRRTALALMNCIYESQVAEISQQVALPPNPEAVEVLKGAQESVLSFHSLRLEPTDCLSIGYVFANKKLDNVCHLDLSDCNIQDVGVELLMKDLQRGKQHQKGGLFINLTMCQITHDGMLSISKALRASALFGLALTSSWHPPTTNINICQALKCLIEGLSRNTSCEELNLAFCCLKPAHVHHLVLMIASSNLKILSLNGSKLQGAICLLAEAVKHNETLIDLHLINCNIDDTDLICLGKAIKTNTTLDGLSLSENPFSSRALEKFVKTLANSNSVLQNLGFDLSEQNWRLLYEDKQDKQHRFLLAHQLQYWGDYEQVSAYIDALRKYDQLPPNLKTRQTS